MGFVYNRHFFCGGRQVSPGDPVPDDVRAARSFRTMRELKWIVDAPDAVPSAEVVQEPAPAVAPDPWIEPVMEIERPAILGDDDKTPEPGHGATEPEPETATKKPRKRGKW